MKHTTIKYDPILGAQIETVDIPEPPQTSSNQHQAEKTATATRMAIAKKTMHKYNVHYK